MSDSNEVIKTKAACVGGLLCALRHAQLDLLRLDPNGKGYKAVTDAIDTYHDITTITD